MKLSKSIVIGSLVIIFTSPVFADDRPHQGMGGMSQPSSGAMMQGAGMGMMDMNSAQDRFKSMQQIMDRMHKTSDPGKRRTLLREHMRDMQKFMSDMHGMMGQNMMGGGNMSMEQWQKSMGQRLDFMQQMMEQMLEQQSQMMK